MGVWNLLLVFSLLDFKHASNLDFLPSLLKWNCIWLNCIAMIMMILKNKNTHLSFHHNIQKIDNERYFFFSPAADIINSKQQQQSLPNQHVWQSASLPAARRHLNHCREPTAETVDAVATWPAGTGRPTLVSPKLTIVTDVVIIRGNIWPHN